MAGRVLTPPVNLWGRNWNRKIMGNFISVILDGVWYNDYYTVGNLEIEWGNYEEKILDSSYDGSKCIGWVWKC